MNGDARHTRLVTPMPPDLIQAIDEWAAQQPEPRPTRSEAIRRLVQLGIQTSIPRNPA